MKSHVGSSHSRAWGALLPALTLASALSACSIFQQGDPAAQISVTYLPTATSVPPPSRPASKGDTAAPASQAGSTTLVMHSPGNATGATGATGAHATAAPAPTLEVLPTPTPVNFAFAPAGPSALITGIRHERQTWNNCGPATISMLLSHYGRTETQREAAAFLKPDKEDKNVSPYELVAYAQSLGYGARQIAGGDLTMLKTLVQNGFPVIVESWFIPQPNDEMGHYQLLMGYEGDMLTFYDSYEGPNLKEQTSAFDGLWKVFNRTAVVVWTPEQASLVKAVLGERMDDQVMYTQALADAQHDIGASDQDKFGWFDAGTSLLALGRPREAASAFDKAFKLKLPWRMMWYQFGPYIAYFNQGRYKDVIDLANATLGKMKAPNLEESFYWRGRAQAALGHLDAARADLQLALKYNSHYADAKAALNAL